jgi:hypothetical protein
MSDVLDNCASLLGTVISCTTMQSRQEAMAIEPIVVPMTPKFQPDLEKTLPEDEDARKLQALGHKQELRRNFSTYSIAAMGFVNGKYV